MPFFLGERLAMGNVFSRVVRCLLRRYHSTSAPHSYMSLLPEGQNGEYWETCEWQYLSGNLREMGSKVLSRGKVNASQKAAIVGTPENIPRSALAYFLKIFTVSTHANKQIWCVLDRASS